MNTSRLLLSSLLQFPDPLSQILNFPPLRTPSTFHLVPHHLLQAIRTRLEAPEQRISPRRSIPEFAHHAVLRRVSPFVPVK